MLNVCLFRTNSNIFVSSALPEEERSFEIKAMNREYDMKHAVELNCIFVDMKCFVFVFFLLQHHGPAQQSPISIKEAR